MKEPTSGNILVLSRTLSLTYRWLLGGDSPYRCRSFETPTLSGKITEAAYAIGSDKEYTPIPSLIPTPWNFRQAKSNTTGIYTSVKTSGSKATRADPHYDKNRKYGRDNPRTLPVIWPIPWWGVILVDLIERLKFGYVWRKQIFSYKATNTVKMALFQFRTTSMVESR